MLELFNPDPGINPLVRHTRVLLAQSLLVLVVVGLIVSAVWYVWPGRGPILPLTHRPRRSPWSMGEIILALIAMIGIPGIVLVLLQLTGFFRWQYGADPDFKNVPLLNRCALWATVLAAPLVIISITRLVWLISGTTLRHLGLTWHRSLSALAAGYLAWLLVTPPVFGLHLSIGILQEKIGLESKKHQLEKILTGSDATVSDWVLAMLVALVAAPVLEELFFRGLAQPWLAKRPWGGYVAWAGAVLAAGLKGGPQLEAMLPMLFVLLFGGVVTLVMARRPPQWQAICGTAMLFAAFHSEAWPAPVPLFFLAVALGWLARRTRSLVAPMILHALFNSVSTIVLLLGLAT